MVKFKRQIPVNISMIDKDIIEVEYLGRRVGICTIQIDGYNVEGCFQLSENIDSEGYNYSFVGGMLQKVIIVPV